MWIVLVKGTLLRCGLPLAPVMAFRMSSPITSASMLIITASIIGILFAVANTLSAFGIGLHTGAVTWLPPGSCPAPGPEAII